MSQQHQVFLSQEAELKKDVNRFAALSIVYQVALILGTVGTQRLMIAIYGSVEKYQQAVLESVDLLSVGYYIGLFIIVIALILFRKGKLKDDIFKRQRKMTLKLFLQLFVIYMVGQFIWLVLEPIFETLLNFIGLTMIQPTSPNTIEITEGIPITYLIYAGLLAPIMEEITYRGAGQNMIAHHGKIFTIIFSGIFFGIIHYHLPQAFAAIYVGMVASFIALEFGLIWAIVVHFVNNFIYATAIDTIRLNVQGSLGDTINWIISAILFVLACLIMYKHRQKIKDYFATHRASPELYRSGFRSIGFIIAIIFFIIMLGWQGIFIK